MVQHFMCALFFHKSAASFCSGRADHVQTKSPSDLRGRNAHAAARAVNKHRLARLRARAKKKGTISCRVRNVHSGALLKRNVIGQPMNLRLAAKCQLRIGTGECSRRIDAITRRHVCNAWPNTLHDAGGIAAGCVRQGR